MLESLFGRQNSPKYVLFNWRTTNQCLFYRHLRETTRRELVDSADRSVQQSISCPDNVHRTRTKTCHKITLNNPKSAAARPKRGRWQLLVGEPEFHFHWIVTHCLMFSRWWCLVVCGMDELSRRRPGWENISLSKYIRKNALALNNLGISLQNMTESRHTS